MENLIPRNNTSFTKNLHEVMKKIVRDKTDVLKYHQRLIHDYLLKYPHIRGILAYMGMGAGKTILAASICESIIESKSMRKVLFLSSKTLHGNFKNDLFKYLTLTKNPIVESDVTFNEYVEKNYEFVTLTASNMLQQVYRASKSHDEEMISDVLSSFADSEGETDTNKIKKEMQKLGVASTLDNTFVVVDEFQNFSNGIINGSKNYVGLYELLMEAKNAKMLFLSGTPVTNDPFELAVTFNLLNGYFYTGKGDERLTLFGEDYDDFRKYFVNHPEALDLESDPHISQNGDQNIKKVVPVPTLKNEEKFTNRIVGLVSYYGTDQAEIQALFPKLEELIVQRVKMSIPQYAAYAAARDKEQEETKRGMFKTKKNPLQKPQGASSSYRVRSRQISNFLYPKYASRTFKDDKGYTRYEKYIDRLKPECFDIYPALGEKTPKVEKPVEKIPKVGKAEGEEIDENKLGIETWSPKLLQLFTNISIHLPSGMLDPFRKVALTNPTTKSWATEFIPELIKAKKNPGIGPGIVYSQFIDSGIGLVGKMLEHYGFTEIKSVEDAKGISKNGTFAIISGEVAPELRTELIRLATSLENKNAELLSLLLITSTGAEGISTKFMRHVHALEPFWHWSRLAQVFARAARLGSHLELAESDRTVQPYIYLSDYPNIETEQLKIKEVEETTDVTLYLKAIQNQVLNESFLKALQRASVDCLMHYSSSSKCKICAPTNERLFIDDLDKDMKSPSPCQELKEEKIKANEIIIEDSQGSRKYMYYIDSEKNIHFLMFSPALNAYQEIFEDHPDYFSLFDKVKKAK